MIRAVLDTSVLVPKGSRRQLQQAAQLGLYEGIWSPWIIGELNRVLTWKWLKDTECDLGRRNERELSRSAKYMMEVLLSTLTLVDPQRPYPEAWEGFTDTDDKPTWAAAVASSAQYVVSDNVRHFPPSDERGRHIYTGVEYLPAAAFLEVVLAV